MKILDFFKKEKEKPKPKPKKEKKVIAKKVEKVEKKPAVKGKKIGMAWKSLKSPHITEKATGLTAKNQYVFKVFPRANKVMIKKAVEDVFGVDVETVKIINIPRKKRRLGRISGWRKGYKKAIVKIAKGQKIELLPR